jgi:hypothetical protein
MLGARWRTSFRPPLIPPVMMGTAALISLAAAQMTSAAPLLATQTGAADCASLTGAQRAAGRHSSHAPAIGQKLDARGEFVGRSVSFVASGRSFVLTLPAESFVGDQRGDALVYTMSLGSKSEIHLVDLATGCDGVLARISGVARSALLSPAADSVYVHSVASPSRADAGVARYGLDGSAQLVVPPPPEDDRFGLTFGTQLGWSSDAGTLFVQSCGQDACRTRLLDVASGIISTFDATDQGQIVGVTPAHLVAFQACPGLPCGVASIDRVTGGRDIVASDAWSAEMHGETLDVETADGTVEVTE